MKTIILLAILLLSFVIIDAQDSILKNGETCPFIIGKPKAITTGSVAYTHPRISKDGTKVLVTKGGYKGIYIIDLKNSNQITTVTEEEKVGYSAKWSEDGENVVFDKRINNNSGKITKKKMIYDIERKDMSYYNH